MKNLHHSFITFIVSILLFGCIASLPIDTVNKQIAAFEISYKQVLTTALLWMKEGRLVGDEKAIVQARLKEIQIMRAAMYAARDIGDLSTASGQLKASNSALKLIRDYISKKEKSP